ncbi:hypothetical protein phi2LM21_p69 [Sinorhizobium phage phi2LM21]|nr:hypothetical protein phi2LM21_p69 [Sinorhizobium phage phi2LM21]
MRCSFYVLAVVFAATANDGQASDADRKTCASLGRIAESVMKRRQDGLSLQSTLEAAKTAASQKTYAVMEDIILAAYEVPVYTVDSYKERAVGEFRDSQHLECLKILRAAGKS